MIRARPLLQSTMSRNLHRTLMTVKRHTTSRSTPPLHTALPNSFAIGSVAGIFGSLAGMGGGFVMIPLMTSRLLNLTQHQAHGTSLFAVMATGLAGAISYGDDVEYESAAAIALTGVFSARMGAQLATRLSGHALKKALGVLMLAMAPVVPAKAYLLQQINKQKESASKDAPPKDLLARVVPPALIGLGSGLLAGVFGVGGGIVVVPAIALVTDLSHHQALATSLAAMSLPAAVGTYTHYRAGNVAMRVAPPLALGAFCGAYLGGKLAKQTDETTLRWGFSGILTVLGVRTILKA